MKKGDTTISYRILKVRNLNWFEKIFSYKQYEVTIKYKENIWKFRINGGRHCDENFFIWCIQDKLLGKIEDIERKPKCFSYLNGVDKKIIL